MQRGDAVATRCQVHAHDGHVELAVGLVGTLAEREQFVEGDAELRGEVDEVALEQIAWEPVDAGRDRGVGGEHAAGAHGLDRLGEGQAAVDPLTDTFEAEEAGVTLVHVEHLRVEVRAHAALGRRRCRG